MSLDQQLQGSYQIKKQDNRSLFVDLELPAELSYFKKAPGALLPGVAVIDISLYFLKVLLKVDAVKLRQAWDLRVREAIGPMDQVSISLIWQSEKSYLVQWISESEDSEIKRLADVTIDIF